MTAPINNSQQWNWIKNAFEEKWIGLIQYRLPGVKLYPGITSDQIWTGYSAAVVLVEKGYFAEVSFRDEPGKAYSAPNLFLDPILARKWCEDFVQSHHENQELPLHYIGPSRY